MWWRKHTTQCKGAFYVYKLYLNKDILKQDHLLARFSWATSLHLSFFTNRIRIMIPSSSRSVLKAKQVTMSKALTSIPGTQKRWATIILVSQKCYGPNVSPPQNLMFKPLWWHQKAETLGSNLVMRMKYPYKGKRDCSLSPDIYIYITSCLSFYD